MVKKCVKSWLIWENLYRREKRDWWHGCQIDQISWTKKSLQLRQISNYISYVLWPSIFAVRISRLIQVISNLTHFFWSSIMPHLSNPINKKHPWKFRYLTFFTCWSANLRYCDFWTSSVAPEIKCWPDVLNLHVIRQNYVRRNDWIQNLSLVLVIVGRC